MSIIFSSHQAVSQPQIGCVYYDKFDNTYRIWNGIEWCILVSGESDGFPNLIPTREQLEKHASLMNAWNEYLIIRKLLGV